MRYQSFLALFLCFSLLFLSQCGSDNSAKDEEGETEVEFRDDENDISVNIDSEKDIDLSGLKNSIDDLEDKLNEIQEKGGTEVVNFRDLKDLLPSRIAGIDRTDYSGEKAGAFGFNVATATAEYEEDDQKIEISIVDVGGIGPAVTSMASWSVVEVDRESKNGYERTTEIDGNKAFEKYDSKREEGEFAMIVDDRFIVSVKGWNVSERELKKARNSIDAKDLKKLAR